MDDKGTIDQKILQQALEAAMGKDENNFILYETEKYREDIVELDCDLVNHVIQNTTRSEEGRLRMPLMWNDGAAVRLSNNFALSKAILN